MCSVVQNRRFSSSRTYLGKRGGNAAAIAACFPPSRCIPPRISTPMLQTNALNGRVVLSYWRGYRAPPLPRSAQAWARTKTTGCASQYSRIVRLCIPPSSWLMPLALPHRTPRRPPCQAVIAGVAPVPVAPAADKPPRLDVACRPCTVMADAMRHSGSLRAAPKPHDQGRQTMVLRSGQLINFDI